MQPTYPTADLGSVPVTIHATPTAETPTPIELPVVNPYQRRILAALNVARYGSVLRPGVASLGHIYAGTAYPATVAKSRKANKAARKARRVHRLAAA